MGHGEKVLGVTVGTDVLKIVAVLSMVADHAGLVLEGPEWLRVVGRLAMPLFALVVGRHAILTRDPVVYVGLLFGFAALSEAVYYAAFGVFGNIFWTLAIGAMVVQLLRIGGDAVILLCVSSASVLSPVGPEYFGIGILLCIAGGLSVSNGAVLSGCVAALGLGLYYGASAYGLAAIGGACLFASLAGLAGDVRLLRSRYLFYVLYPAHLMALVGVAHYV